MGFDSEEDGPFPELGDLFAMLSNERRRYALQCLHDHGPQVSLPDLADEVSVRSYERPISDVPEEDVLDIYISLYHQHIPKLADADLVRYEQERDLVEITVDLDGALRALPESLSDSKRGK